MSPAEARDPRPGPATPDAPLAVVAIGGSAGAIDALTRFVPDIPPDIPAAVLVAIHIPPFSSSALPAILRRKGHLPATHAEDGEPVQPGRIYVAPPDRHLVVQGTTVRLGQGPKENGSRPALDPLFRSAAASFGRRAIAVVLSGVLDDGTAGVGAVNDAGGVAVAQDPEDALYGEMPRSAIENMQVDHVVSVDKLGALLARLADERAEEGGPPMSETDESLSPERRDGGVADEDIPGAPSAFSCPDCSGVLWEMESDLPQFRCRVGHKFSPESLLAQQEEALEGAMWAAVRALEESAGLQHRLADRMRNRGHVQGANRFARGAHGAIRRAALIRRVLSAEVGSEEVISAGGGVAPVAADVEG